MSVDECLPEQQQAECVALVVSAGLLACGVSCKMWAWFLAAAYLPCAAPVCLLACMVWWTLHGC
jgi:hypothetical protein